MISQTVRHAFRILGRLAGSRDGLVRGGKLADGTGIPANDHSAILNQLHTSVREPAGTT